MKTPLIEVSHISVMTHENRVLFKDLNMHFSQEKVAIIGRNGVGKSTLLKILSGKITPQQGRVVLQTEPYLVCQYLNKQRGNPEVEMTLRWFEQASISSKSLKEEFAAAGLRPPTQILEQKAFSHGEFRKLKLLMGKLSHPQLLILDEPTQGLDERGILWLKSWLAKWQNGLIVVSHEPQLLQDFEDFFIVAETGCRYFSGNFETLQEELEKEHRASEIRYLRNLNRLIEKEEHISHIARRRGRKKRYGRVSELDRATPKQRLNQKRDGAQVKHGRMKKIRDTHLAAAREWTKSTRRSLGVKLPLALPTPELPKNEGPIITMENVSFELKGRSLFKDIHLCQERERLALIGPNGAGKTTLLEIMLGKRSPTSGFVKRKENRIGSIAQGGSDWIVDETVLSYLSLNSYVNSQETLAELLIAHKFPLALAQRPMHSLSPGERVRAALICLFQRLPAVELLILDEPTYSLDLVGQRSLTNALKVWPGGLIIASHSMNFLEDIGMDKYWELGK